MWAALCMAAIALAGTAFMLWFLVGLLREGAPSVWYWVVPACRKTGRSFSVNRGHPVEGWPATESNRGDYRQHLSENQNYAKQECASGLIALSLRPDSGNPGGRSVRSASIHDFCERGIEFE